MPALGCAAPMRSGWQAQWSPLLCVCARAFGVHCAGVQLTHLLTCSFTSSKTETRDPGADASAASPSMSRYKLAHADPNVIVCVAGQQPREGDSKRWGTLSAGVQAHTAVPPAIPNRTC